MKDKKKDLPDSLKNIIKHSQILKTLAGCKGKLRTSIIQNSDRKIIEAVCECVLNLLNGNIKLSESDKKSLEKYKFTLRKLVEKSNLNNKKKILIQHGGFLQFLIPAAITGISSIISSLISRQ